MRYFLLAISLLILSVITEASAQLLPEPEVQEEVTDSFDVASVFTFYMDSIESTLTFHRDTVVSLGDGLADLAIPQGYNYVNSDDAQTVLTDMWGNPPSFGEDNYGMLFKDSFPPSNPYGYGIVIDYTSDGYIDDSDAADIDYDDLLEEMQDATESENESRAEAGYQAIQLVGWATPPRYDQANKRLHWAKDLLFEGEVDHTLNYNILFLGRRGYLTMNVIGNMDDLDQVNSDLDDFLGSITYQDGNRYADFDSSVDEVAAYGIGALIAGKVLAKTGLLAGIGIFLAKAWKLIAIALVAIGGGFRKFFSGGK